MCNQVGRGRESVIAEPFLRQNASVNQINAHRVSQEHSPPGRVSNGKLCLKPTACAEGGGKKYLLPILLEVAT